MKVIYLTSAQHREDFNISLPKWKVSPNLSNQNFHNHLIEAISIVHDVFVISIRPINPSYFDSFIREGNRQEGNIVWNYPLVKSSRVDKLLNTHKRVKQILLGNVNKDDVIVVDTLNLTILQEAIKIKNKYNIPAYGICTDSPYNISFTSDFYKNNLLKLAKKLDGYIVLTEKLNQLYNPDKKPSVVIEGITEINQKPQDKRIPGKYLFFGGSLMKKYGSFNLIDAFNELNISDLKLVLCGHHEEIDFKNKIESNKDIIYLGALNYEENRALEYNALACINPRPNDEKIDLYSIPSKTLEYLSSGSLTISTDNPILKDKYSDAIIWAKQGTIEELKEAILVSYKMKKEERNKKISLSLELINKYATKEVIAKEIKKLF